MDAAGIKFSLNAAPYIFLQHEGDPEMRRELYVIFFNLLVPELFF